MIKKSDHLMDHHNPKDYLPENTKSFKAEKSSPKKARGYVVFYPIALVLRDKTK